MADEYIKREAVLALTHEIHIPEVDYRHRCIDPDAIKELPAADVAPVVRCKDCRHRDPEDNKCDSGGFERQGCPFKVSDDYFCAYGER